MNRFKLKVKNVGVGGYNVYFPDRNKILTVNSLGKLLTQDERHGKKINWKKVREFVLEDVIRDECPELKNKDLIFEWI